jgi:hypothetical protein
MNSFRLTVPSASASSCSLMFFSDLPASDISSSIVSSSSSLLCTSSFVSVPSPSWSISSNSADTLSVSICACSCHDMGGPSLHRRSAGVTSTISTSFPDTSASNVPSSATGFFISSAMPCAPGQGSGGSGGLGASLARHAPPACRRSGPQPSAACRSAIELAARPSPGAASQAALARLTEVPQLSAADCTPTLSRTSRERSRGRATAAVKPRLPRGGSAVSAAPWARTGPRRRVYPPAGADAEAHRRTHPSHMSM